MLVASWAASLCWIYQSLPIEEDWRNAEDSEKREEKDAGSGGLLTGRKTAVSGEVCVFSAHL